MAIYGIVATSWTDGGIGSGNTLPWRLKKDLGFFKGKTTGKNTTVIMGRLTWESIGKKMPNRRHIVVTSAGSLCGEAEGVLIALNFVEALELAQGGQGFNQDPPGDTYVCGGGAVYRAALESNCVERFFVTRVSGSKVKCDAFFPIDLLESKFCLTSVSETFSDGILSFDFTAWEPLRTPGAKAPLTVWRDVGSFEGYGRHNEYEYLDLLARVMTKGTMLENRTGTRALTLFGERMTFSLEESFPLLTTKQTFWRGIVAELLWFIKGSTDSKTLASEGVHIWDANGSRAFLDSRKLFDRAEGDLGPIYGFQWRHFGAEYIGNDADYKNQGVDQLATVIELIRSDPTSRRIVMSAWNPTDLDKMALPPCHVMCQFHVDTTQGTLSSVLYQRSADLGLGVPFNIASYALLTYLIAHVTNLKPSRFTHFLGNAHVYENHVEALQQQLRRIPRPFPVLKLDSTVKEVDSFEAQHIKLHGYQPHPRIPMDFAL